MSRKKLVTILFLVVAAAVALTFVLPKEQDETASEFDVIGVVTQAARAREGLTVSTGEGDRLWWNSPEGYSIISPAGASVGVTVSLDSYPDGGLEAIGNNQHIKYFYESAGQIMRNKGFRLDDDNTSDSLSDDRFYDYVRAYAKGDIKCAVTVSPDVHSTGGNDYSVGATAACTDNYDESYEEQKQALEDLGYKGTEQIAVGMPHGDGFYTFSVNGRRAGTMTIAKMVDGKYVRVYTGQDAPPCSLLDKHDAPESLYSGCYED